ncbi:unnamed protein product [Absidia cylindrospora]
MKNPTRHVYSRDLDVVLEENNMHQGKSYLDQVLEPNPLGFLRNGKTQTTGSTSGDSNHDKFSTTTTSSTTTVANNNSHLQHNGLPTRRARAGTMPSMMSFDSLHSQPALLRTATHNHAALNHNLTTATTTSPAPAPAPAPTTSLSPFPQQHRPPMATPVGGGRHRSGSLNLPPPSLSFDTSSSLFWSNSATPTPPSPATEQLLQGDSDFSIARTMRSLGLEDSSAGPASTTATTATTIATTTQPTTAIDDDEELINQSRASLLASASNTTTRNRSYSVNATVRYDPPPPPMNSSIGNPPFTLRGRGNTVSKSSFGGTPPPQHHHISPYHQHHYHQHLLDPFSSSSPPLPPPPSSSQQQQQRTRSISFGQTSSPPSFHGLTRPSLIHGVHGDSTSSSSSSTSSLWQMHRPLTPVIGEEEHMSLGDSELLANMYDPASQSDAFKKNHDDGLFIEPYMHLSHSTPTSLRPTNTTTNRSPPMGINTVTSSPGGSTTAAVGSRSLWIGNIDASITVDVLTHTFAPYGPIESVRLLMEKECAFVNYFYQEHAVRAKEDVLGPLAGRVGHCIVRIGYGRADAVSSSAEPVVVGTGSSPQLPSSSSPPLPPTLSGTASTSTTTAAANIIAQQDQITHQATRALWLGNIPTGTSPSILEKAFDKYGTIESIRILSHKTCAFINFDSIASASDAQDAFLQQQVDLVGFDNARIGFAKVPPPPAASPPTNSTATPASSSSKSDNHHQKKQQQFPDLSSSSSSSTTHPRRSPKIAAHNDLIDETSGSKSHQETLDELWNLMISLDCMPKDKVLLQELETPSTYADAIPRVPDFGPNRQIDANRLRDIRKKMDTTTSTTVCDNFAKECMPEIAELCSDYIGNTVMQRFFDKCSEPMKLAMLERIAPHLAAIGIHKNGTWAAQKILGTIKTPKQCALVRKYVKTYVPALLLDQFGNYVVQCCLRLGEQENQFVFDAMVENCEVISHGRFGARAMRGILESEYTAPRQQTMMAACLLQHTMTMVTHPNGSLLVAWLMDTYTEGPTAVLVSRTLAQTLTPRLASVATHKLGSQLLLKLIHQSLDKEAQDTLLSGLVTDITLKALLMPPNADNNNNNNNHHHRGIQFFQKVIYSSHLSQAKQHVLCARAISILLDESSAPSTIPLNSNYQSFLDELNVVVKG